MLIAIPVWGTYGWAERRKPDIVDVLDTDDGVIERTSITELSASKIHIVNLWENSSGVITFSSNIPDFISKKAKMFLVSTSCNDSLIDSLGAEFERKSVIYIQIDDIQIELSSGYKETGVMAFEIIKNIGVDCIVVRYAYLSQSFNFWVDNDITVDLPRAMGAFKVKSSIGVVIKATKVPFDKSLRTILRK